MAQRLLESVHYFGYQQKGGEEVKEQVEDVDRPAEVAFNQQTEFFYNMRFGGKGGKTDKNRREDKERSRDRFKPFHRGTCSYRHLLFDIPTSWVTWTAVSSIEFPSVLTDRIPYLLKSCSAWPSSWAQVEIFA